MCGIAGLVAKQDLLQERYDAFVASSDLMRHRGPDNKGVYRHENVLLIHHRLSILDLDERANQPFQSASGLFTTVYNGEIYNYRDIAARLSLQLKTTSDTEVMLESFEQQGITAVGNWNGIFSAAIYDNQKKQLYLCRDRFGVKPLYLYESDEVLAFASEAKVLLDWLPAFSIDPDTVAKFLWYGNSTGRAGFVKGLSKLPPGAQIRIDGPSGAIVDEEVFWALDKIEPINPSKSEAIAETGRLLEAAVKRQLVSDVPVGVLLSGGVDSSSIVAFAAKHYGDTIDTYSVEYDFNIGGKSELEKAAEVARRYGTNHNELRINVGDVEEIFTKLVYQFDEPFADSAAIPLYQLAEACSKDKRVVLQGDGGDELFAGYRRYNILSAHWLWRIALEAYRLLPAGRWRERLRRVHTVLQQPTRAEVIAAYLSEEALYSDPLGVLATQFRNEVSGDAWDEDYIRVASKFAHLDWVQQIIYTDISLLLPFRYLEKVDKATMLCSLEARVPFLDNELAEFAISLPSSLKVKRGEKKYILKEAMKGIVPRSILYGAKRGFDVPVRQWLKGGLYEFARDSFAAHDQGILNTGRLLSLLESYRAGRQESASLIWKSLVLCHWLSIYEAKLLT